MMIRQHYWSIIFVRYKEILIDWFESIDLIETIVILYCVRFEIRFAIDIDVVEIDIEIDFVILTYHDVFLSTRAEKQFYFCFD